MFSTGIVLIEKARKRCYINVYGLTKMMALTGLEPATLTLSKAFGQIKLI